MDDLSGVKVRVMQNNIFLDTFQTMGAMQSLWRGGSVHRA
jgi:TRAP-type C4-dicarboxylate transport system substrate-binding protein